MPDWYFSYNGQSTGPCDEHSLQEWITAGHIDAYTPVWQEGMADWTTAGQTELAGLLPAAQSGSLNRSLLNQPGHRNPYYGVEARNRVGFGDLMFSFDGRIARRHFWLGMVVASLLSAVLLVLLVFVGAAIEGRTPGDGRRVGDGFMLGRWVILLLFLWMRWAIYWKRWHDLNYHGAGLLLLALLPEIGVVGKLFWKDESMQFLFNFLAAAGFLCILAFLGFMRGTKGLNRFGKEPS